MSGNIIYYPIVNGGSSSGTVTSVSLTGDGILFVAAPGPAVTTSGTLTPVLNVQQPNKILAGPVSGPTATPTFRSLVLDDLPVGDITGTIAATQVAFGSGSDQISGEAGFTYLGGGVVSGAGALIVSPAAPAAFAAPSIVSSPTGSTDYTYQVVANNQNVAMIAGTQKAITNGPATLDASDTNTLTWTAVLNATTYDVYRLVGGATQGLIARGLTSPTLLDNGIVALSSVIPLTFESGFVGFPKGLQTGPLWTQFDDAAVGNTSALDGLSPFAATLVATGVNPGGGLQDFAGINAAVQCGGTDSNIYGGVFQSFNTGCSVDDGASYGIFAVATANVLTGHVAYFITGDSVTTQGFGAGNFSIIGGHDANVEYFGTGTVDKITGFHVVAGDNTGATGVITDFIGVFVESFNHAASATLTNSTGVLIQDESGFGTNTYGIHIEDQATSGATHWAIKVDGGTTELDGSFILGAVTPTTTTGQIGLGTTAGFGAGSSGTAVTTTTKGGGTGPTTPQTVVNYLEIDIAGTKYWIPLVQ